ncbi:Imm1 family immunity protein [Amycolatopsis carbonis]|uniref:Imm1 family immunity protein n=1 Tax=Amycolatopsis carbonis TaxID=715471 RepID=A0A9Y2IF47_9PSEU|nr:Imm1 family immunity protein [Amycolatopsis sp. 2-15]WIX78922.1 Imm1 family immunity protein [Amycolatopsis sp. 2-15]
MAVVKAWYDPGQAEPFELAEPAEVDALLDRMVSEATAAPVGVVAELAREDRDRWSILQFGVRTEGVGFVGYMGKDETSVISASGAMSSEPVAYDYQAHEREVPSHAEVSWQSVRQAVHDYVASRGARPGGVTWQEV